MFCWSSFILTSFGGVISLSIVINKLNVEPLRIAKCYSKYIHYFFKSKENWSSTLEDFCLFPYFIWNDDAGFYFPRSEHTYTYL